MTLRARLDEIELFKSSDTSRRGTSMLDVLLKPEEIVPIYVLFAPSATKPVQGKIVMKSEQSDRKYTVRNFIVFVFYFTSFGHFTLRFDGRFSCCS